MNWYYLSVLSLLFFGIQKFLFKVAAENKCSTKLLTLSFMVTVFILSFIMFLLTSNNYFNFQLLLYVAFFNGFVFLLMNIFRYEAIKLVPSTVVYPLFEFSNVIVITFSFLYFKDRSSLYQTLGIILGLVVVYLLGRRHAEEKIKYSKFNKGLIFVLGAVIAAAISPIISKIAATSNFDTLLFITVSYLYNSFFVFMFHYFTNRKGKLVTSFTDKSIIYGTLIGITNFIAFYVYLKALGHGSLSLVTVISSFSTTIPVILSILIYKDKMTWRRFVGISLAVLSLFLLKN